MLEDLFRKRKQQRERKNICSFLVWFSLRKKQDGIPPDAKTHAGDHRKAPNSAQLEHPRDSSGDQIGMLMRQANQGYVESCHSPPPTTSASIQPSPPQVAHTLEPNQRLLLGSEFEAVDLVDSQRKLWTSSRDGERVFICRPQHRSSLVDRRRRRRRKNLRNKTGNQESFLSGAPSAGAAGLKLAFVAFVIWKM